MGVSDRSSCALAIFGSEVFQDAADNRSFTASLQFACRTDAAWEGGGGAGAPGFELLSAAASDA